jgi:transcriptional regulator with XRE-family HTH domain
MPIVFSDDFPFLLVDARAQAGMTQQELADKLGVSRKSLSRYESGHSLPRPNVLLKLSEVLKVDPGWLTGAEEVDRSLLQQEIERYENIPRDATGMPVHLSEVTRRKLIQAARQNNRNAHDELVARLESTFDRSSAFYADVLKELSDIFKADKFNDITSKDDKGEG